MYDTIVVPTDGSEHAITAAGHAAAFARRFDATAHVLAIVDVQGAAGPFDAGGVTETFVERLEDRADDDLAATVAAMDGDSVTTARVRGGPSEAILEYADDQGADLLAMGTHGRTGVDRYVAGSVTERVLRRSAAPVLTARAVDGAPQAGEYDDVVVPTDGSDAATAAVDHAIAVATEHAATVHAVSVVDVTVSLGVPDTSVPPTTVEIHEERAEAAVEAVADRAREADLDAETAVVTGSPASSILDYAADRDVDLLAMGTTGQTGLSRHLLGSTTERVVRHAERPVVAVNARE
jgi:nucleotide-binding universal stress UspA family protein